MQQSTLHCASNSLQDTRGLGSTAAHAVLNTRQPIMSVVD